MPTSDKQAYGLFKRGQDKPILTSTDADLLQRTRKREYGLNPDYKVAPASKGAQFAEVTESAPSYAGLQQTMAEARYAATQDAIKKAAKEEVSGEAEQAIADAKEAAASASEGNDSTVDVDDDGLDEKLTGDTLKERAAELDIEGRSSMNADELREAIAKAEASQP